MTADNSRRDPPSLLPSFHAKSVREGGQSFFVDAQGVRFPSVTTILNATKPPQDWEALMKWRDRVGAQEAAKISGTASRRGTQTHKHIQNYLLGKEKTCPETALPYWNSIEPVLASVQQVKLIESSVFHYDLRYAGKVDCVASYHDTPCICDWKTADRPKGSIDRLKDAPLQLAAYCGAVNHSYADHNVKLVHALLVIAIPNQPAEVFWFEPDTMRDYWQQWQDRLTQYNRFKRDRLR